MIYLFSKIGNKTQSHTIILYKLQHENGNISTVKMGDKMRKAIKKHKVKCLKCGYSRAESGWYQTMHPDGTQLHECPNCGKVNDIRLPTILLAKQKKND